MSAVLDAPSSVAMPSEAELADVFRLRFGDPAQWGRNLRLWRSVGYWAPDQYYEALLARLVEPSTTWLDVGGGHDVFPDNRSLAERLAARCRKLVAVDPDPTLDQHQLAHERVRCAIEEYQSPERFQLVSMRMVAEHLSNPDGAVAALAAVTSPGGLVVVYTVNRNAPVSLAARWTPFAWHHRVKALLWKTNEEDTFPVVFKMNTRRALAEVFGRHGFDERLFERLDDCRLFCGFPRLHRGEIGLWRLFNKVGLRYPETCLLGVYERRAGA